MFERCLFMSEWDIYILINNQRLSFLPNMSEGDVYLHLIIEGWLFYSHEREDIYLHLINYWNRIYMDPHIRFELLLS